MKVKLLKKIRKRYGWYVNSSGFSILIKHSSKTILIIDKEYLSNTTGYTTEDIKTKVEVSLQEWSWRHLKDIMYNSVGLSLGNAWYNKAVRKSRIKNRNQ